MDELELPFRICRTFFHHPFALSPLLEAFHCNQLRREDGFGEQGKLVQRCKTLVLVNPWVYHHPRTKKRRGQACCDQAQCAASTRFENPPYEFSLRGWRGQFAVGASRSSIHRDIGRKMVAFCLCPCWCESRLRVVCSISGF